MSNRVLEFVVRAKDATGAGLQAAGTTFQRFRSRVSSGVSRLVRRVFSLRNVMLGMGAAVGGFVYSLKTAFEFERYETQFKVLFGNLEQAKRHMAELQEFSASTPFQLGDIAQASRQLHVFTGGAMGAADSMRLIGDAAAAVNASLQEVGMWVGRAYAAIKGGLPFGEASMRLMELGILTPEVRAEMEALQKAGADNIEIWAKLQGQLDRFNGGMEELSKTGEGLVSTMKDNWKLAIAEFGNAFTEVAKDDIGNLSDSLKRLRENGDIAAWANKTKRSLQEVSNAARFVGGLLSKLGGAVGYSRTYWEEWTDLIGSNKQGGMFNPLDNMRAAWRTVRGGGIGESARRATGRQNAEAAEDEQVRQTARKRVTAEVEEKRTLEERIAQDMAAGQRKIDEQLAKEKAEKEKAETAKADRERAREQTENMRRLVNDEKRLRVSNVRAEMEAAAAARVSATDRLSRAETAAQRAWGWYRDPEAFRAQLAEEEADAKAQAQFAQDSDRLQRKRGWRTRDLGASDEAVRRVILAREEEQAARIALTKIEANTRHLAAKLEELLRMK